jgi:hypothetical protein
VERQTPEPLARGRVFTIAFFVLAAIGLVISVIIPLLLPGPKLFTIALGSGVFVLILVFGAKLLRRIVFRSAPTRGHSGSGP